MGPTRPLGVIRTTTTGRLPPTLSRTGSDLIAAWFPSSPCDRFSLQKFQPRIPSFRPQNFNFGWTVECQREMDDQILFSFHLLFLSLLFSMTVSTLLPLIFLFCSSLPTSSSFFSSYLAASFVTRDYACLT